MPEHKIASQTKEEKADQTRRTSVLNPQPPSQNLLAWDVTSYLVGETPFNPPIQRHADLLLEAPSANLRATIIDELQRTYGNQYIERLINRIKIQAKFTAGSVDDPLEREADCVSEQVVNISTPTSNKTDSQCESPKDGKEIQTGPLSIQQNHRPSMIQRKIVVGGKPYKPTKKYYDYLDSHFGPHMKEFIKKMHNDGNPPDYVFDSYEQMGYEVRVRHQAIKGIEKAHQGGCSYPDSSHPEGYLDVAYWDKIGWMNFKPKSPLPSGKEASDAIEAIFASSAGTQLECLSMTIAVEYYSLLKGLGKKKFNTQFPGGAGIEISASPSHQALLSGATQKHKIVSVSSASDLLPGDWVYFKNFKDYPAKNPTGSWQGENAIYLGNGKYRGFGVSSLSETDMNAELVSTYNNELGEHKTVANLIADGGGLQLDPVVRLDIAKATP